MRVLFLGTGAGLVSAKRKPSSILVKAKEKILLFDTGPGIVQQIAESNISLECIDAIFYTHFHIDHISDLAPFIFFSKSCFVPREKDLYLYGPKGLGEFYDKLVALYGAQVIPERYRIYIEEIGGVEIGGIKIETVSVAHREESIAYRITENGKSLCISGDTEYCESLIALANGCDLLILECSLPKEKIEHGHLTSALAARLAEEAGVERLALTHFYQIFYNEERILREVRQFYRGEVILAKDLMEVEIL
jgi:ribonuclease BN (tRNA processing enzyme)